MQIAQNKSAEDIYIDMIQVFCIYIECLFWLQYINKIHIKFKQTKSMDNHLVVTLTGFNHISDEEKYKTYISDLNMRFAGRLSEQTTTLVVKNVTTEKYKIAKLYVPPKICVTSDWLRDCKQNNKIFASQHYLINQLFYGATIIIFDFPLEKAIRIEKIINQNGGNAIIITSINKYLEIIKQYDISVVLITKANFQKLLPYLESISVPLVDLEWLEQCLHTNICKFPYDFALNLEYIKKKSTSDHFKKMKNKLERFLDYELQAMQLQTKMLENTIIYLADNINGDLALILKKIIMVCGGIYLDQYSPFITHVLTDSITQNQYLSFKNYSCLIYILRVEWLIDSIYLSRRMSEEDYFIRSFKQKNISSFQFMEDKTIVNSISQQLNLPTTRKTISLPANYETTIKHISIKKKFNSQIFKQLCFYIESSQRKQIQIVDLNIKIQANGGIVYKCKKDIKKGLCYYVLKDSPSNQDLIKKLVDITHKEIQPISYRWINQCLLKRERIMQIKESYIYKPFNFKTPIPDFHKLVIDVIGVDDIKKMRLKQLCNALGSMKNKPNKIDITHCLCGSSYKSSIRFYEIKKQNQSVKFIDWKWLIECANTGKIADTQTFLLENQNIFGFDSQSTGPKSEEKLLQRSQSKFSKTVEFKTTDSFKL